MNYSQQEIKKKQRNIVSASRKIKYRVEEWIAYCSVIAAITLLLLLIFGMAGAVRGVIDSAPKLEELDILAKGQESKLYDSNGNVIQILDSEDVIQEYVSIDQIPDCVKQAFISIEDKRFYEHHGVDMLGLVQSVYSGVIGKKEEVAESSTITQQLIQNQILGGNDGDAFLDRFTKEIQQQQLAIELEDNLDKPQILEYYLNTINMGQSIMGVQAAAKQYFDKDISEISISEAAVLAAITSDPTRFNPVTQQESNAQKRQRVLKSMLEDEYISEDDYEDALGDDVYLRIQNVDSTKLNGKEKVNSYYSDAVVEQVIHDLKEKLGYSQTEAYNALYRGGLKIYTCQNPSLQKVCDEVINTDRYYPKTVNSYLSYHLVIEQEGKEREYNEIDIKNYFIDKKGKNISLYFRKTAKAKEYVRKFRKAMLEKGGKIVEENVELVKQPQASFVLLEQATGEVKAIVGGRGQKLANRDLNRATESKRQPGSALAMLSTYAPALDTAGIALGSVEDDVVYFYPGTNTQVKQWGNGSYQGLITLREAITHSKNIPAVKTLKKVSVQTGYEFLKKFSLTTIVEQKKSEDGKVYTDLQLQLATGELNEGVTNLELTAAYAAIANGGVYQDPHFYTKIVDRNGNVLLESEQNAKRILKETTAWLLTDAMEDVIEKGSGKTAKFDTVKTAQAGNVGHTEENTDFWFEGYTPYYTAGIWSGQDENTSQEASDYHIAIWKDIMEQIHKEEEKTKGSFRQPEGIVSKWICSKCGNLAVMGLCDEAEGGSTLKKEYFVKGKEPEKNCSCHAKYAFCKKSKKLATSECPEDELYYRILLKKTEASQTEDSANTVEQNIGKDVCDVHVSE